MRRKRQACTRWRRKIFLPLLSVVYNVFKPGQKSNFTFLIWDHFLKFQVVSTTLSLIHPSPVGSTLTCTHRRRKEALQLPSSMEQLFFLSYSASFHKITLTTHGDVWRKMSADTCYLFRFRKSYHSYGGAISPLFLCLKRGEFYLPRPT